jgi:Arc/MetJ-type ribon-helix-helix transcriptional regulator
MFAEQAGRLADRLRTLSDVRLAGAFPPYPSRADAVRALLQDLADAAADLEARPRRTVPLLPDLALGDQLAVLATDLLNAADGDDSVLTSAAERCLELRRAL